VSTGVVEVATPREPSMTSLVIRGTRSPVAPDAPDRAGTVSGLHPAADAGSAGPADPGLLRIEFTSPAKPALITRAAPGGDHGDPDADREEADFRYLVVPLRSAGRA